MGNSQPQVMRSGRDAKLDPETKHLDWYKNYLVKKIPPPKNLKGVTVAEIMRKRDDIDPTEFDEKLLKAANKLCGWMKEVNKQIIAGEAEVIYTDQQFTYEYKGSVGVPLKVIIQKDHDRAAMVQYSQMQSPVMVNELNASTFSVHYTNNPTNALNKKMKDRVSQLLKKEFHDDVHTHIESVMSSEETEIVTLRMNIATKKEKTDNFFEDYTHKECVAVTYAVVLDHMVIDFVAVTTDDLSNPDEMFPILKGKMHSPVPKTKIDQKIPKYTQHMRSKGAFEFMLHTSQALAHAASTTKINKTTLMCHTTLVERYKSLGMKEILYGSSGQNAEECESLPVEVCRRLLGEGNRLNQEMVIMQSDGNFPRVQWQIPQVPHDLNKPLEEGVTAAMENKCASHVDIQRLVENWTVWEIGNLTKQFKHDQTYTEWGYIWKEWRKAQPENERKHEIHKMYWPHIMVNMYKWFGFHNLLVEGFEDTTQIKFDEAPVLKSVLHAFNYLEMNLEHKDDDLHDNDKEGVGPTGVMLHCIHCDRYCKLDGLKAAHPNGMDRKKIVWNFCLNAVRQHFGLASLVTGLDGDTRAWELANPDWFATSKQTAGLKEYFCPELKGEDFEILAHYAKKDRKLVNTKRYDEPTQNMRLTHMQAMTNTVLTGMAFFEDKDDIWSNRQVLIEDFMEDRYKIVKKEKTEDEIAKGTKRSYASGSTDYVRPKRKKPELTAEERENLEQRQLNVDKFWEVYHGFLDTQTAAKFQAEMYAVEFVQKQSRPKNKKDLAWKWTDDDEFFLGHTTGVFSKTPNKLREGFEQEYAAEGVANTLTRARQKPNKKVNFPATVRNALRRTHAIANHLKWMTQLIHVETVKDKETKQNKKKYYVTTKIQPDIDIDVSLPWIEEKFKYREPQLWWHIKNYTDTRKHQWSVSEEWQRDEKEYQLWLHKDHDEYRASDWRDVKKRRLYTWKKWPKWNKNYMVDYYDETPETEAHALFWIQQDMLNSFAQVLHHLGDNKTANHVTDFLKRISENYPEGDSWDNLNLVRDFLLGKMRKTGDPLLYYNVTKEEYPEGEEINILEKPPDHAIKILLLEDDGDRAYWHGVLVGHFLFWNYGDENFGIHALCDKALDQACIGLSDDPQGTITTFKKVHSILYVTRKTMYKNAFNNLTLDKHDPREPWNDS